MAKRIRNQKSEARQKGVEPMTGLTISTCEESHADIPAVARNLRSLRICSLNGHESGVLKNAQILRTREDHWIGKGKTEIESATENKRRNAKKRKAACPATRSASLPTRSRSNITSRHSSSDGVSASTMQPSKAFTSSNSIQTRTKVHPHSSASASALTARGRAANVNTVKPLEIDQSNLLGVHEFREDKRVMDVDKGIVYNMQRSELLYRANADYLSHQASLTPTMRATLFDWMFEVGQEYLLSRETLHTALNYVDRYLSTVSNVPKQQLQLVGVTALWIAAKTKEVHVPKARDFAYSTDRAYEIKDLVKMEMKMLCGLRWNMNPVTAANWIDHYIFELGNDADCEYLFEDEESSFCTSEGSPMQTQFKRSLSPAKGKKRRQLISRASCETYGSRLRIVNPNIARHERMMEIIDMALLDIGALHFPPSAIAATAFSWVIVQTFGLTNAKIAERITRYTQSDLHDCILWMGFALNMPLPEIRAHPKMDALMIYHPQQDHHCVQRHNKQVLDGYKKHLRSAEPVFRDRTWGVPVLSVQNQIGLRLYMESDRNSKSRSNSMVDEKSSTLQGRDSTAPYPMQQSLNDSQCAQDAVDRWENVYNDRKTQELDLEAKEILT